MANFDDLYERMEDSANRATDAAANFNAVLTEDDETDVMVDGRPVPSMSKRIKLRLDEGMVAVDEAVAKAEAEADRAKTEADRAETIAGTVGDVVNEAKAEADRAKTEADRAEGAAEEAELQADRAKKEVDSATSGIDKKVSFGEDPDTHIFADEVGEVVARFDREGGLHLVGLEGSVQEAIRKDPDGADVLVFTDADRNIVAKVDSEGGLHLVGLEGPIQGSVRNWGGDNGVFLFVDALGNIVARFDREGGLHLVGLEGSVQEAIRQGPTPTPEERVSFGSIRSPRDSFSDEANAVMAARSSSLTSAPPPLNSLPQRYSLGNGWVNSLFTSEGQPIRIDTTYRDNDGVVHPYLCEFYNGFRGFRYILGITGYYNTTEAEENPFVFGSNDLQSFELLEGFKQPLADRPDVPSGHNSDVFFTYDPRTGELICCWRQSVRNSPPDNVTMDSIWCRKTQDGFTWSEAEVVFPPTRRGDDILLSPSILFDPRTFTWHMYEVKTRYLQHRTSTSLHGPWGEPTRIPRPAGVTPWHLDVRWCGDKHVMLIHDNGNDGGPDNLYFGISNSDFTEWTIGDTPVVQNVTMGMYKATFVPTFEGDNMAMDIVWTGDAGPGTPDTKWRLFSGRTNFVNPF